MRNEELDELLATVDVIDYLDYEAITWKRTHGSSGSQANIKECPKCGGSDWKVYLNVETGLGNCFHGSCSTGFNKWSFIKAHVGTDDARAVIDHLKEYARKVGWRPARKTAAAVEIETPTIKLPASFPLPTEDGRNLMYLETRGIPSALAQYFSLRYCEDAWWNFTREDGKRGGQNFGGRVLIPVFDLDGKIVTFQGRAIAKEADPKYLFPAGLPASGRFLFNAHNALRVRTVVLNEGAFDVAATKIAIDEDSGLRHIVPIGSFGKHLSGDIQFMSADDQLGRFLQLMRQGLQEVIIMWDGEKQALLDALDAGEKLIRLGLHVKIALLPRGKDPNEVHPQIVREAIYAAKELTVSRAIQWRLRNPYR